MYASLTRGHTHITSSGIPDWENFVPDTDIHTNTNGNPRFPNVCSENPQYALYQSRILARYMLKDIWLHFDSLCECHALWEGDREVCDVRLKRALVGFSNSHDEDGDGSGGGD